MDDKKINKLYRQMFYTNFIFVIVLYLILSMFVYRFKHPEQTETQLFLNIPKALLWK